jgi:hypothetical protein
MRQLGQIIGRCAATVKARIDELIKAGYVEVADKKNGQRAYYSLTSPVFAQKQGKADVIVSTPRGKRLVSVERRAG